MVIIAATFFFAAFVKGVTGMGFTTTCLPFLVYTVGLKRGLPLVLIPSLISNFFVMVDAGDFGVTLKRFWPMFLTTAPGVVFGLWILDSVPVETATMALGVVLILYALIAYFSPSFRLPPHLERPVGPISGFITGTVNGVTGTQIMTLMPFLMSLDMPRNQFIQGLNISFSLSTIIMSIGLWHLGLLDLSAATVSMTTLLFVWAGTKLGGVVRKRMSNAAFRTIVLGLLFVLGFGMFV
ncbi:sulfite exporter TauE/SafE family protein [Rhodobacteraceae bacterium RKSG542]|nr:sulfite exporter TauE/SafE family protein [Pseudovibrio flavus]